MAKKEITISQYLELNWSDNKYTDEDEKYFRQEAEEGYAEFHKTCNIEGHDRLMFNPEELIC